MLLLKDICDNVELIQAVVQCMYYGIVEILEDCMRLNTSLIYVYTHIHLHLVPRSRMRGAIPPILPICLHGVVFS